VLAEGCDLLILPTTPDGLSLDALMLTVSALRNIGATNYAVLLTIVPPRPNRDGEDAMKALTSAELPVFPSVIRRFVAYQRAAVLGVPVYETEDRNANEAWQDYITVGKEIAG
jgi:chromosome partitioning protein